MLIALDFFHILQTHNSMYCTGIVCDKPAESRNYSTVHKFGPHGRVVKKKKSCEKKLEILSHMQETWKNRYSGQMRPELNFLAQMQSTVC